MNLEKIKKKLAELQNGGEKQQSESSKHTWRPTPGKHTIRILPSAYNDEMPFTELLFHYNISRFPIFSPKNYGEKDPILEFVELLRNEGGSDNYRLAKKLDAKVRTFVPIIVRGEEENGVKLWGFGKEIYTELLSLVEDEDIQDYTDVMTGRDFTVTVKSKEETGTGYSETSVKIKMKTSPLSEDRKEIKDWTQNQPNPVELFDRVDYDKIKEYLENYLTDISKDEEDNEETSEPVTGSTKKDQGGTKSSKFSKLFDDDEEEEVEEEEEEQEVRNKVPKSSQSKSNTPARGLNYRVKV